MKKIISHAVVLGFALLLGACASTMTPQKERTAQSAAAVAMSASASSAMTVNSIPRAY